MLSNKLMKSNFHHKRVNVADFSSFNPLFQALAVHHSMIRSEEGLTLEMSAFFVCLFTVEI